MTSNWQKNGIQIFNVMCTCLCNSVIISNVYHLQWKMLSFLQTKFWMDWFSSGRLSLFIFMFFPNVPSDNRICENCILSTLGNTKWYSWHSVQNQFYFLKTLCPYIKTQIAITTSMKFYKAYFSLFSCSEHFIYYVVCFLLLLCLFYF